MSRGNPRPAGTDSAHDARGDRVLAFTPTWGDGPRTETLASIAAQQFDGVLVHELSRENPYPGADMRNVLAQYVRGRELALAGGYDALWCVEHDMQCGPDALGRLWATGAPVAYGVYVLRHGSEVLNAWEFLPRSKNLGESLSLAPGKLQAARKRGVTPVSGVGFGCTLIRRAVLERLPFRSGASGSEAPDVPFATDCVRAGIRQVADFGVLCGHYDPQRGRWLLPLAAADDPVRVRANQDVTVRAGTRSLRMTRGAEYDLPAADASEMARAGYVTAL